LQAHIFIIDKSCDDVGGAQKLSKRRVEFAQVLCQSDVSDAEGMNTGLTPSGSSMQLSLHHLPNTIKAPIAMP
jgi:hypothetical protein